jgi:hypothetical protein
MGVKRLPVQGFLVGNSMMIQNYLSYMEGPQHMLCMGFHSLILHSAESLMMSKTISVIWEMDNKCMWNFIT